MAINAKSLAKGVLSYILPDHMMPKTGTGGTNSAEYCYSVWLRHLSYLMDTGLVSDVKELKHVAEIGPGDSLGIGISALFTGATNYYAFDLIAHSNIDTNRVVNQQIADLFIKQTPIPNSAALQNVKPVLKDYSFPKNKLSFPIDYYTSKQNDIDAALQKKDSSAHIDYIVPWVHKSPDGPQELDLIFSQAVMEHVIDIESAYQVMYKWLKKGGIISHQIDFKAHEISKIWNEHWFISKGVWEFLMHGRKYPINRYPLSYHISCMQKAGFEIKNVVPHKLHNSYGDKLPIVPGVVFTKDDLETAGAFIQAVKPQHG